MPRARAATPSGRGRLPRAPSSALAQGVLDHADVALVESGFAVRKVELPQAHEAVIEAEVEHAGTLVQEGLSPAPQCFGVVPAERQFIDAFESRGGRRLAKFAGARQAPAREDVLLDEVGRADVARPQSIVDHDRLDAGPATRLQQTGDALEVGRAV